MISRRGRTLILVAVLANLAAGAVTVPVAYAQTTAPYGSNLVVNGDAEADVGAPSNNEIVKPTGWTTTGEFTAVQYGASGGFPDASSPGPPGTERGKNLFEGGNVASSTATQRISLAPYASDIDAGSVSGKFSAWVGGFEDQEDNAYVTVSFADAAGASLVTGKLGPVTAKQRDNRTGLLLQMDSGPIPKGARTAVVTIVITREEGTYNDGAVDNVALVLTKAS